MKFFFFYVTLVLCLLGLNSLPLSTGASLVFFKKLVEHFFFFFRVKGLKSDYKEEGKKKNAEGDDKN